MNIEHSSRLWLPRTGQTATSPTANYAVGDDGYFRAGNPRASRFIDNGNGTVSDRATGLTWVKQPELIVQGGSGSAVGKGNWADSTAYALGDVVNDGGAMYQCIVGHTGPGDASTQPTHPDAVHWVADPWTADAIDPLDAPATMTWANAVAKSLGAKYGGLLSYAGFTDWRLPNWLELATLFDAGIATAPTVNAAMFPNTKAATYWTATTLTSSTGWANTAKYTAGYAVMSVATKAEANYVRPVRGGRLNANG